MTSEPVLAVLTVVLVAVAIAFALLARFPSKAVKQRLAASDPQAKPYRGAAGIMVLGGIPFAIAAVLLGDSLARALVFWVCISTLGFAVTAVMMKRM